MNLETLFCAVTSVTVLTSKGLLCVSFVTPGENVGLQVPFRGGYVNTLWAVPSFATASNLDVRHGVIILPRPERMELVASTQKALHHDGVRRGRAHVRRVLAEELHQACYWEQVHKNRRTHLLAPHQLPI